jgi:hypothetical protein
MATVSQITQALKELAPGAQFTVYGEKYSDIVWYSADIPEPTEEALNQQLATDAANAPLEACKRQASQLLYETDWTTIPDVADPTKSNPYLVNVQDYVTYRSALRQLAVYPVANPVWPTKPVSQWGTP